MTRYDVVILTQKEYIDPVEINDYVSNVLLEDQIVCDALNNVGLSVKRVRWDCQSFDWSQTKCVLIRAVWDYFNRFDEFKNQLEKIAKRTIVINPPELVWWNIDKHYLRDLANKGINIVPTIYLERNSEVDLKNVLEKSGYQKAIIKPVISGAARLTFILEKDNLKEVERIVHPFMEREAFMLQPFINSIVPKGEVSHMIFNGEYTHSILKIAKPGDFRVQDDFGGTVHEYTASPEEIEFSRSVVAACEIKPLYARVDLVWDNDGNLAVAELEAIEPELWFREQPEAASVLATAIRDVIRLS